MSSQKSSFSFNHSCVSSKQLCPSFFKQNGPNFLTGWMNKCWLESAIPIWNAWNEIIDDNLSCYSIYVEINDVDASAVDLFGAKERIYKFLVFWDCLKHCEKVTVSNCTSGETFCVIVYGFELLLWINLGETLPTQLTEILQLIRVQDMVWALNLRLCQAFKRIWFI